MQLLWQFYKMIVALVCNASMLLLLLLLFVVVVIIVTILLVVVVVSEIEMHSSVLHVFGQ